MDKKRMPIYGIKGKLVSACCMLLVAVIMVVSSTYAWFTLSTAPEVKGITTQIGSNGALEIRLDGKAGDPNAEYGNIVDLSEGYGLDEITLYPSELHLDDDGKINLQFLNIPQYGANGKVTELSGERTEAGSYNGSSFVAGTANGVRAVGVASGLTDRQLAYRNAKYAASTNAGLATNKAASSLNTRGAVLGSIVIKKATVADATYTKDEIAALQAIVTDLTDADTGVLQYIQKAYEQMIVAYAASGALDTLVGEENVAIADAVYSTVKANIADRTLTLESIEENEAIVVTALDQEYTFSLAGTPILTAISAFNDIKTDVAAAQTAIDELEDKAEYEWAEVSAILTCLIDTNNVTVNGWTAAQIQADTDGFAVTVMNQGINIQLNTGAGVYADIADQCGNYSAKVTMTNVVVKGMAFDTLTANMATNSTVTNGYLALAQAAVLEAGEPSGATTDAQPMTEFYGYIIDLVFRTNAANSSLLLQTEATDRIYEGNQNESTQGGGSYMTFASADKDFTTEQVKGLMKNIRIVFFDPSTRDVLGYAMLDVDGASVGVDGVTAKMYLYESESYYYYTTAGGEEVKFTCVKTTTGEGEGAVVTYEYFAYEDGSNITDTVTDTYADAETKFPTTGITQKIINTALTGAKDAENAPIITALAQNQEVKVSALVYLDGRTITNADVAATGTTSVTGKMNLQFSSTADLVPMEYGDLHVTDTNAKTPAETTPAE